jgi:hypothetical protein
VIASARFGSESRDAGLAAMAVHQASGEISSSPVPLWSILVQRMDGRERGTLAGTVQILV